MNDFEFDETKECEYLRKLLDFFMLTTFTDKVYFKNNAIRAIIRELLLNKGIKNVLILI